MVNLLNKKMKNLLILFCLLSAGFTAFSQTLSSKEFRPQVGFGAGYFSFYGEVSNKKANSPLVGQMGFYFDVSRKINSYFDLGFTYINGTVTGNQNSGAYLNFQTRINSFSAYGLYNWGHFLHNKVIQPYTSIGFETFEFNSKADLVNSAGNPYFHWDDGSIKNIAQTAPNAADAIELKRDYDYESDLRGLNLDGLGNYARVSFSVPVGLGLQFNISDRFTLRMGSSFHYTFTDNVDNVSQAGKGLRQGNASNDYFFYNSASLHYNLLGGAARAKKDFQFVDYFAINTTDTDNDGVFDWYDRCSATPKGVAVDSSGCPLDSDHDGVADYLDKEESAAKAFVNASGVEMTDADYEKWYRRYIDSLDIPYEILVKLADANRSGSSIYRVLVGEYSKKIPDNLADKFLAQPDIIAAPMNDTVIGYLVGKFADIELAKARQKQLLDDNPELMAEIEGKVKAALAAIRASNDSSFKISTSFVATSAATIPARTSPVPAVANHGVAFGSSINCSLSATKVMAPFSRTVTFKVSVAICTHLRGSPSIASALTCSPRDLSNLASLIQPSLLFVFDLPNMFARVLLVLDIPTVIPGSELVPLLVVLLLPITTDCVPEVFD